jgi:predicted dehydrogenase
MRRFILVGLGSRASEWLPTFPLPGVAEIVAYVEPNPSNSQARADEFNLRKAAIYPSFHDALKEHPEADSVFDIVPPMAREEVVSRALDANLHVLSEKPLAPTLEQAKRLLQLARKRRATWMITQDYRFAPLPRASRRIVESGTLGEIGVISLTFWKTGRFSGNSFYAQMESP